MKRKRFGNQPLLAKAYISVIVAAGAAVVVQSIHDLATGDIGWNWTILALLTLLSGSATVSLPSMPATVSVSETFVFTSAILFGSSAGTVTVALDAAIISFWSYRKGQPAYKILFNVCALPLTIWVASHLFFLLAGIDPLFRNPNTIGIRDILVPLVVFTIVYFGLNSWIITIAIAMEKHLAPFTIWKNNFARLSLNYFGGASVAALFVSYTRDLDYTYFLVIIPLLFVLYYTFSSSVGRVEDANRHLTELNALYMSTIETLAMAIDAKDQITHGHIRRVQTFAVGLARKIGVNDPSLIKAIEAAALLHDMGKLAVPEYILNKPGPLTDAEFEKMKLHAGVGADILSSINFPYPVVPIVRHHHENWNGTGYPDKLRGTNIPIGARILSVVDCFDALTSDRPYRPRLSDAEAIRILTERRGSMYDPLIVDTFIKAHAERSFDFDSDESSPKQGLSAITRATHTLKVARASMERLEDITSSTEEMLVLYDLASAIAGHTDLSETAETIAKHIRRLLPVSTCVFYVYDDATDELVGRHSHGECVSLFDGLKIARGQRLTGWVAANKQTIVNSDPVLDLGEAARVTTPRLRSCLSTPLQYGQQLVGVLTVYSTTSNAYSDDHRRIIEAVAKQVSQVVKHCLDVERDNSHTIRRGETKISNLRQVEQLVEEEIASAGEPISIILVDLPPLRPSSKLMPSGTSIKNSEMVIRQALRAHDVVVPWGPGQLLIVLSNTDISIAESIRNRIADAVAATESAGFAPGLMLRVASGPAQGATLEALVSAARNQKPTVIIGGDQPSPFVH